jgi:hypothetical protein
MKLGIEIAENWYWPKAECEQEGTAVLWNEGCERTEDLANRRDIIIKNKT